MEEDRERLDLKAELELFGLRFWVRSFDEAEGYVRPPDKSNTYYKTTQATLVETKAVAAQAGCVREDLGPRPPVR